jgi:predicted phosphate transport protein (TIGR00153 family)
MRFRLIPTDDQFFVLFNDSAANAADCSRRLREVLTEGGDRAVGHAKVIECEHRGDEIVRAILQRLNTTFVTPFDREDIHALAEELDNVVDDMLTVSHLIQVTQPSTWLPELTQQADVLVQMADETVALLAQLESMRNVQPHLEAIDRFESQGDAIYRSILSRLFSGEFEAMEVLRWKDTVEALEKALNSIEDISNVVESIVLKHA